MSQFEGNTNSLKECLKRGKDYYEVRLESIGGLGANLCGKMLGELGVKYLDMNSSSFSSYGSEKTGTPVKGYIRYCNKDKEIRVHSPVVDPDVLVIFHQALLNDGSVLKGCSENTAVIIATASEDELSGYMAHGLTRHNIGVIYTVDAQKIAMETHSRINVVMLGATLKIMGIEDISVGEQICKDTLGNKYPEAMKGNIEGMKRGYEEVKRVEKVQKKIEEKVENIEENVTKKEKNAVEETSEMTADNQLEWGYETAPIGGINPRYGSTVIADLSPSRQGYIPIFIKERCINCGLCHSTCPDMVFQFKKGEYKGREMMVNQGLDYYHCKGCLRCVDVCPVQALVRGVEAEHPEKPYFIVNQELIRMPDYYEKTGPDGYITSESFLTEKRMEGGEV